MLVVEAQPAATPVASAGTRALLSTFSRVDTRGHPDLANQYAALDQYFNGQYGDALYSFKRSARYGDKFSQLSVGLMYANGRGVSASATTACAWLTLASFGGASPMVIATRQRVCNGLAPQDVGVAKAEFLSLQKQYGNRIGNLRMTRALQRAREELTSGSLLGNASGIWEAVAASPGPGGPSLFTATDNPGASVLLGYAINEQKIWRSAWWNPTKYIAERAAAWRGTVTVGAVQPIGTLDAGRAAAHLRQQAPAAR